jgi:capsule polysaccharide export protein KpsE/RkpR
MAQASNLRRKYQRVKRERTIAFRMLKLALSQRDQAREIADHLQKEYVKVMKAQEKPKGSLEIIKPEEDEPVVENHQAD